MIIFYEKSLTRIFYKRFLIQVTTYFLYKSEEYFRVYIRDWYPVECLLTDARHWKLLEHDKAKLPRQPRLSRSTVGMFKNSNWMCLWNNEVQFNLYLNATPCTWPAS